MAMAKLGSGITDIEGGVGGDVYRTDQCGQHIQASPRHVYYARSPTQKKRNRAFKRCLDFIRTHATPLFAGLWQEYANQHPKTNKKGETIALTWAQMFLKMNIPRVFNDLCINEYPPEE